MKKRLLFLFALLFGATMYAENNPSIHLHFATNKANLSEKALNRLDLALTKLPFPYAAYTIEITGHTDAEGHDAANLQLSRRRARAVMRYLSAQGLPESAMTFDFKGEADPLANNDSETGKARNRRVEVLFRKKKGFVPKRFDYDVPMGSVEFDASEEAVFQFPESGTMVRIPGNALIDAKGRPVKGKVTYTYREYRDVADFIASGIPMYIAVGGQRLPFNSGGMFELNAWQKGKRLRLKDGNQIELAFVLTDTVPDLHFWEFDGKKKRWEIRDMPLGDALPPEAQPKEEAALGGGNFGGGVKGRRVLEQVEVWEDAPNAWTDLGKFCYANAAEAFQSMVHKGQVLAREYKEVGNGEAHLLGFSRRYHNKNYSGIRYLPKGSEAPETAYLPLRLEWVSVSKKRKGLRVVDEFGEHSELDALKSYVFVPDLKKAKDVEEDDLAQRFRDFRVVYKGAKSQIYLEMKSEDKKFRIPVRMYKTSGKRGTLRKQKREIKQTYREYAVALKNRADDLNSRIVRMDPCFMLYSWYFMTNDERALGPKGWIKYFAEHPDEMLKRYEKLADYEGASVMEVQLLIMQHKADMPRRGKYVKQKRWRFIPDVDANAIAFARQLATYNSNMAKNETEEERIARVKQGEAGHRGLASMVIGWNQNQTNNRRPLDAGHTFPKLVQELFTDGFGLYNNDQIRVLGKTQPLAQVKFVDEKGKKIRAYVASLMDLAINGAMSFHPKFISYNPKAKNKMLLFGKDGQKYLMESDQFPAVGEKAPEEIVLRNVTKEAKDLKGLKALLGV